MSFEQKVLVWRREFELEVQSQQGKNSFVRNSWRFADPHFRGLVFEVSTNDDGDISIISSDDMFRFGSLNIAEGYSQELMCDVVFAMLSGNIKARTTRILGLPLLIPTAHLTVQAAWLHCSPWFAIRRTRARHRAADIVRGYRRRALPIDAGRSAS